MFPCRHWICCDCFDKLGSTTPRSDEMSDHDEQQQEQDEAIRGTVHGTRPPEDNSSQDTAILGDSDSDDEDEAECSSMSCPSCRIPVLWAL